MGVPLDLSWRKLQCLSPSDSCWPFGTPTVLLRHMKHNGPLTYHFILCYLIKNSIFISFRGWFIKRRSSEITHLQNKCLAHLFCISFAARSWSAFSSLESWFHPDGVWWTFDRWGTWESGSCTATNSECEKGVVSLGLCVIAGVGVWRSSTLYSKEAMFHLFRYF